MKGTLEVARGGALCGPWMPPSMGHCSPRPDCSRTGLRGADKHPPTLGAGPRSPPGANQWQVEKRDLALGEEAPTVRSRAQGISEMSGASCHPAHGTPGTAQPSMRLVAPSWQPVPPQISQPLPQAARSPCCSILTTPQVSPGTNPYATHTLRTHSQENRGCPCPQRLRSRPSAPTQAGAADKKPFGEEGA